MHGMTSGNRSLIKMCGPNVLSPSGFIQGSSMGRMSSDLKVKEKHADSWVNGSDIPSTMPAKRTGSIYKPILLLQIDYTELGICARNYALYTTSYCCDRLSFRCVQNHRQHDLPYVTVVLNLRAQQRPRDAIQIRCSDFSGPIISTMISFCEQSCLAWEQSTNFAGCNGNHPCGLNTTSQPAHDECR